ncbi:hypothetical protein ACFL3V_02625 [Nanoarchaeota archaeon]
MKKTADFHNMPAEDWKRSLESVFDGSRWVQGFIDNWHHGIGHGFDVRQNAISLIGELNDDERSCLISEGADIDPSEPLINAVSAVEIASVLHDCGRFDDLTGDKLRCNQDTHAEDGAERAETFCRSHGINGASRYVVGAVLSHDYWSGEYTPNCPRPDTMVGRIVQAADQIIWFTPETVERTHEVGKDYDRVFFDPSVPLEERLNWDPSTKGPDTMVVMLAHIAGYKGEGRFSISPARKRLDRYQDAVRKKVLELAETYKVRDEVDVLIDEYIVASKSK